MTLIERSFWSTLSDPVRPPFLPFLPPSIPPSLPHLSDPPQHPNPPHLTLGVAYLIPPAHIAAVRNYLDLREINGYTVHHTPFTPLSPADPAIPNCLVYIGTPSNPQFVGPQHPQELAELIYRSRGPSGENTEYLYMMDRGLLELEEGRGEGEGDEHVRDLAERVRALEAKEGGPRERKEMKDEGLTRFRSEGSTDEVEEVEKEDLS